MSTETFDEFLEIPVIVRSSASGVHVGRISKLVVGDTRVTVRMVGRRLWQCQCVKGVSLTDLAVYGIDLSQSRISAEAEVLVTDVCEIITIADDLLDEIIGADIP